MSESESDNGVDLPTEFAGSVRRYAEASREAAQESLRRIREAAQEYSRTVFEIQQQTRQPAGADYEVTIRSFQSAAQEAQQRWQGASSAYQDAAQAAAEEFARRQEQAFREYLAGLQNAWAHLDPATIDGPAIAAIQHAMVAAAVAPETAAS